MEPAKPVKILELVKPFDGVASVEIVGVVLVFVVNIDLTLEVGCCSKQYSKHWMLMNWVKE